MLACQIKNSNLNLEGMGPCQPNLRATVDQAAVAGTATSDPYIRVQYSAALAELP